LPWHRARPFSEEGRPESIGRLPPPGTGGPAAGIRWWVVGIFYEDVLRALDAASIRFVLVGGVAVVLHGVPRTTADLDLVIDLEEGNVRRFVGVMTELGFARFRRGEL
jgi:hypothetical protein